MTQPGIEHRSPGSLANTRWIEPQPPRPLANTLPIRSMARYLRTLYPLGKYQTIDLMGRVFTNGPGDRGSILGQVIPKTQKMLVEATLLNTQHYKVQIKGKVEQSREWSSTLPNTSV